MVERLLEAADTPEALCDVAVAVLDEIDSGRARWPRSSS